MRPVVYIPFVPFLYLFWCLRWFANKEQSGPMVGRVSQQHTLSMINGLWLLSIAGWRFVEVWGGGWCVCVLRVWTVMHSILVPRTKAINKALKTIMGRGTRRCSHLELVMISIYTWEGLRPPCITVTTNAKDSIEEQSLKHRSSEKSRHFILVFCSKGSVLESF